MKIEIIDIIMKVQSLIIGCFILHDDRNGSGLFYHNFKSNANQNVFLFLSSDQHYSALCLDGKGKNSINFATEIERALPVDFLQRIIESEKRISIVKHEPKERNSDDRKFDERKSSDHVAARISDNRSIPEWMK